MLDQTTKRKIDSARNILVGKVPDPKAQVEQITTALIYKFMDDMDKESEELGGEARFFTNGFSQYSWTKLLDKRLSGEERLDLYVQAITNMSKNPHIPQLFRDIFKGAFLPFRDPRTLTLFLKEINEFTYDHSENLGNAFEYLLSILGSQGDAGQFRTPRHIIDFIVEVVDPKKNETILDPACGTAGFLISAYKHILEQSKEKPLTPDEKTKLMNNIVGYDISPDMVKLSLVNMYLHGFQDPKIYEYDTLSSEKRWDETFDVIMANPPFMTPKGGIRPHKKFSIQANRAEVLFVDYIMEHLNINGRAGIIVPEGIIFKGDRAYKALRKKLVEDGLFAVVSLPAGVFQPYSGVKTSILLFDNQVAKKTDEMLFIKIENDGFDLGAQRRPIEKNDLPKALEILQAWKTGKKQEKEMALWVKKEKIAESGDYNLTGERYREVEVYKNEKWPMVELGKVCEIYQPKTITSKQIQKKGKYKVFGANGVIGYFDDYNHEDAEVAVTCRGATCGNVNFTEPKSWITGNAMVVKPKDKNLDKTFLFYFLQNSNLQSVISGSAQPQITRQGLSPFKIPLPPLSVQKEIVEQIEVKQNAINHAREIIKNLERERRYFGQELRKLEDVEWVELGDVCDVQSGGTPKRSESKYWNGDIPWLGSTVCKDKEVYEAKEFITKKGLNDSAAKLFKVNTTLLALVGATIGKTALLKFEASTNQNIAGLYPKDENRLNPNYLFLAVQSLYQRFLDLGDGKFKMANLSFVKKLEIPLPPLAIQKQLVAEAEKEEEIIKANKYLIKIMEKKIEKAIKEI